MTLGVYADGVWRNIIGNRAAQSVFDTIKDIIKSQNVEILVDEKKRIVINNMKAEQFTIETASDPDITIMKGKDCRQLCIEIKGGQDVSNIHNRAGEAEKSHQKAAQDGWLEKWTVIYLVGLQPYQEQKLHTESPATDKWFDVNEVCARSGKSYIDFSRELRKRLGL